ncbi:MAG: putative oxygen-independent coproporphyrinogen III oxidase [Patiriisocius sp.]|jgi:oxygen-independent coproporphyrinogen-3 oxidase
MRIPLALYIHIPWCVQTCPYCDFNSHQLKGGIPEDEYIAHILADLDQDLPLITLNGKVRSISSIFIGGGTPSLLSIAAMHKLLNGVRQRLVIDENAEITMEANPGSAEADKFLGFTQAGINRISIGVQSFQQRHLQALGRIHDAEQSHNAITFAQKLPLSSFNADLMHGLPEQSLHNALDDLSQAIAHNPPHLSWYQLTIEPNTLFHSKPPVLPNDDILWEIQLQGQAMLQSRGYEQYEISAYGQPGHRCEHNLNYWRFGDYLGIGCGAHGKITNMTDFSIIRTEKVKHPKGYMDLTKPYLYKSTTVIDEDLAFEFFMNRFRLVEACPKDAFLRHTGRKLNLNEEAILTKLVHKGLLEESPSSWQVSELGRRYLNSLLEEFA